MNDCICPLDYRYGRKEMKSIFTEESRIQYQMNVEAALARAHASLGTISTDDADEITRVASLDVVQVSRIKEIEKETNHDLMAMVKAMTEQCKGNAGKYVHLGATSNDIVDTATALQIRDGLKIVQADIDTLLYTFATISKRERDTLEIGRTHAQFAIPITFGFKIAGYIAELLRHKERLQQIMPRACAGKMAGAVGTGAALGKNFRKIQTEVMADLEITFEPAATQVVGRDRYTELICLLANIATSLERYGTEVRNLQRSEIAEASEAFNAEKQVGSSTMAQKRNPINSENVCGLARVLRGFVTPTFENQVLWHERDLSNSSAERFTLPHVFVLIDEMLFKMNKVFTGLEIHSDKMLRNIESAKGLIMAEPVMMKLTEKGLGRQDAHEIVREASMVAVEKDINLREALLEREDVKKVLTKEEIIIVMDPANYVGASGEIVDMMIADVEQALGKKV
ncbi:MAG: adenylosuccinate lyase [Candidatus Methanomethylophilaceae archaeon]|nr:adenylosuccinate lyase [Candidatus Methanomethylophilaceae archaeon]MDD3378551.1 adenylosuccinate lyase [Candidatus Methanomethylophilaceae archaeon]MDY0224472.1 adenylosuccinate lyase [Candidatus Methanomethylophilaceae archaeon]